MNGATQAITGLTSQRFGTGGAAAKEQRPIILPTRRLYFSNSGQILRSDDLNGTNLISYGTQGSDVGQFYGAYGIALDPQAESTSPIRTTAASSRMTI